MKKQFERNEKMSEINRYFLKQKAWGVALIFLTVAIIFASGGDATVGLLTIPLGLMLIFTKKKVMLIDEYYFEIEKEENERL